MGRKHEGGCTAGGGRSGRRGGVSYNRVIPKFLQRLADPDYTANPIDAKRDWVNAQLHDHEELRRREKREEREEREGRKKRSEHDVRDEIRKLQADGFRVVESEKNVGDSVEGVAGEGVEGDAGIGGKTEAEPGARGTGESTLDKGPASALRLKVRGGIEKKGKRTPTGSVANVFGLKNRHKLSFAESDSDGDSDHD